MILVVPPLINFGEAETCSARSSHIVGDLVVKPGDLHRPSVNFITRLAPLIFLYRVEFAHEQHTAAGEHAASLCKDEVEVPDMLENKAACNEVLGAAN